MAATKLDQDRILNQLRVKLTGASDGALKAELHGVFYEFFDLSSCWLEDIDFNVIASAPGVAPVLSYVLSPSEGQIIRLAGVIDKTTRLPQPALMPDPDSAVVILANAPNQAQGQLVFTATVAKNVVLPDQKDAFPVVPPFVLRRYFNAIEDGVLGRMMAQANKSWTDKAQARYHLARFQNGIATARVAALRRYTIGSQAWSFPQGFRSYSQRGGISVPGDRGFA